MLKKLLFIFIPVLSFGQLKVNYKVFYSENMASEGMKIQVSFQSKTASDSSYFHYSNNVWGQENLINCFHVLESENPGYQFKMVPDSNRIVVYHPKSKHVSFFYHIRQDYNGDSLAVIYRPRIRNDHFHILGENLFTVPEAVFENKAENHEFTPTIEWVGFPSDYIIHNTFGTRQQKQVLTKVKLWGEFYHSVFVGGDYRIIPFEYAGKPIYFAIRGKWFKEYQDDKLINALQKTITAQRQFWKDDNFEYYTIIMTPSMTRSDSLFRGQSTTGSGVHNAFVIQSTNNPFNNWEVINYIFNHEMMHNWIGGQIAMKHEELNYWFSEGFTDYYTYKNRLRSKDISFTEWLEAYNKNILKAHWQNPERKRANYTIKDDFWKSRDVEKIPYRRGAIFAFWLDNQILKRSNYTQSLDDLMKELLLICTKENKKFTDELFLELAQKYTGEDISYFFQKHILNGIDFDFKNEDLIDGFGIEYTADFPLLTATKEVEAKYIIR